MADHMRALGFAIDALETFEELVYLSVEHGAIYQCAVGTYFAWSPMPELGIELWAQADVADQLVGCTPYLRGEGVARLTDAHVYADPEVPLDGVWYGHLADAPGAPCVAVHMSDLAMRLPEREEALAIAAFAHSARCWPDPTSHFEDTGEVVGSASATGRREGEHLAPEEALHARAHLSGVIQSVARHRNQAGRGQFYHMVIALGEATLDVVADTGTIRQRPREGGVIAGEFWLCSATPALPLVEDEGQE